MRTLLLCLFVLLCSAAKAASPLPSEPRARAFATWVAGYSFPVACWGEGRVKGADASASFAVLVDDSQAALLVEVNSQKYVIDIERDGNNKLLPLCGERPLQEWQRFDGQVIELKIFSDGWEETRVVTVRDGRPVVLEHSEERGECVPKDRGQVMRDGAWDAASGVSRGRVFRCGAGLVELGKRVGRLLPTYAEARSNAPAVAMTRMGHPAGPAPTLRVVEHTWPPTVEIDSARPDDVLAVYYPAGGTEIEVPPRPLASVRVDAAGRAAIALDDLREADRGKVVPFVVQVLCKANRGGRKSVWSTGAIDAKGGWYAGELVIGAELPFAGALLAEDGSRDSSGFPTE